MGVGQSTLHVVFCLTHHCIYRWPMQVAVTVTPCLAFRFPYVGVPVIYSVSDGLEVEPGSLGARRPGRLGLWNSARSLWPVAEKKRVHTTISII